MLKSGFNLLGSRAYWFLEHSFTLLKRNVTNFSHQNSTKKSKPSTTTSASPIVVQLSPKHHQTEYRFYSNSTDHHIEKDHSEGRNKMEVKRLPDDSKQMDELKFFDDVFPQIINDIMSLHGQNQHEIQQAMEHFKEINGAVVLTGKTFIESMTNCNSLFSQSIGMGQALMYNVPGGKKNRGLAVVSSYKCLVPVEQQTDDNLLRARLLGWCVEILQAYFLVADDIMDESPTRRGKPCWYKRKDIGMIAINDCFFIDSCIYMILKKYFRNEPYYIDIMELFHETVLQTSIGQSLDLQTATSDHTVDFSRFSKERYAAIVKWKTAFYSFYLPVALAMCMAGIKDSESHATAKHILLKMGHFFQVQDDYLDCYGDPDVIGKIGTDIRDNKCSWLINEALDRASLEQRKVLQDNYAQSDPAKEQKVKDIFDQLKLKDVFARYEEDSYQELMQLIDTSSSDLPKQLFVRFAEKIYKRKK